MEQIGRKQQDGRDWEMWSGSIGELRQLIPTFSIHDFRIGEGINKYKSVIVREPYGVVDIGAEIDPMKGVRIPIQVVRKRYKGVVREKFTPKDVLLGYDLVQHYDLLDRVLETLKTFSERVMQEFSERGIISIAHITPLTKPESLAANLEISTYGARMRIEFLVQNFKYSVNDGAPYVLKVACRNSMDKRIAVGISLHLYREGSPYIPFRGFYSQHKPEELKGGAIESHLYEELMRIARGDWITATVDSERAEQLVIDNLSKNWVEKILIIIRQRDGADSDPINLHWFREKLSELIEGIDKVGMRHRQEVKVLNLLYEIDKVVEEETNEKKKKGSETLFPETVQPQ